MIEILTPKTREEWLEMRRHTIGASEVAAVLGVHPYMTPYELWSRKIGTWVFRQETKAMRRGRLLEDDCIEILREERPEWNIILNAIPWAMNDPGGITYGSGKFYRDLGAGISATPDAFIINPALKTIDHDGTADTIRKGAPGLGIIQIKTVNEHAFRNGWIVDGEITAPTHIAIQAIQEAHLTGASWACVAAFVGMDLEPHIIDVELHTALMERIKLEVPIFLRSVSGKVPPPQPDYARDGDIIKRRYAEDDGGEIDLSDSERVLELIAMRREASAAVTVGLLAKANREDIDAELIHILGNATRGNLGGGHYIEAKTVRKKECVHHATTYRAVKIKHRGRGEVD